MPDKRLVHEILSETGIGANGEQLQRRPVAFIQHGNLEDGFLYEIICPWCGETCAYVPKDIATRAIGGLYRVALAQQKIHWTACEAITRISVQRKPDMAVEITTTPLGTEKLPSIN